MESTSEKTLIDFEDLQDVFNAIDEKSDGHITKSKILDLFEKTGIRKKDKRIKPIIENLEDFSRNEKIDYQQFQEIIGEHANIVQRVVKKDLIIPDFSSFEKDIRAIYKKIKSNTDGKVASYIPQLARVEPEQLAISICTIDDQRLSIGDTDEDFCVQSVCKPINYCIAMELNGEEKVHNHVGREPSGRSFNEIAFNRKNLPHNPMINAGAIMCSSLIKADESLADRFDHVTSVWHSLSNGRRPGFNNSVYHSEKETADRNFALAHFMRELGAFPNKTSIQETLDFYFQCCSIEMDANRLANVAATFANSGINPATGKRVFSADTIKNCSSLMYSCGMYDFSGEFAFTVGLPAKSGVSGSLMIVIPNVMGIAIWSPRLDEMGNSVRGVEFCKELIKKFNFHNYDSIIGQSDKTDPRQHKKTEDANQIFSLIQAAWQGDLDEIKRLVAYGADINASDYDLRTPLHLAATEGRLNVVEYLVAKGANYEVKDRFGNSPLSDAKANKHEKVVDFLNGHIQQKPIKKAS